jgi:DNA-directed RNA polymerase specialized sigma24 family protein
MTHWDEGVLRAVRSAAARSYAAQRGFVETDDLMQEGYEWVLKNQARVNEWVEEGREGFAQLHQALYRAMHRYTMRQRYLKDGTKPGDYFFYQLAVIQDLLPEAFDNEPNYGQSASDLNAGVRSGKPLSEGGDRMAMIADVKAGLASLDSGDYALMVIKYGQGEVLPDTEIAQLLEVHQTTVNRNVNRVLRKIAKHLGSEPVSRGRRRVMSNAQAQHETRELEAS